MSDTEQRPAGAPRPDAQGGPEDVRTSLLAWIAPFFAGKSRKRAAAAPVQPAPKRWTATGYQAFGLAVSLFLVFGVGVWSAFANISGAVLSQFAELRVEGKRKVIEHLDGGMVAEILVRNGDVVKAGEVVMRLDRTAVAANLAITDGQLDELTARSARLEAEAHDAKTLKLGPSARDRVATRPTAAEMLEGQRSLFQARLATMEKQMEQLRGRVDQIGDQIDGAQAQIKALDRQLALIGDELKSSRSLLRKGLIQKSRVLALEREEARLAGERAQLVSQVAQLRGRIGETELRMLELRANRREQAIAELRDVKAQLAELREKRTTLADQLSRMEIRAPDDGVVHELAVTTVGAVVTSAKPIMYVVPTNEKLVVEARIETISRDQVRPNQDAMVMFPGFNQRTTPTVKGIVTKISADRQFDEATRAPYYLVEVTLPDDQLKKLRDSITTDLAPGMPAEVQIQTGERSAASYFIRPLGDYFSKALREE